MGRTDDDDECPSLRNTINYNLVRKFNMELFW
jgi:hypothetical protein